MTPEIRLTAQSIVDPARSMWLNMETPTASDWNADHRLRHDPFTEARIAGDTMSSTPGDRKAPHAVSSGFETHPSPLVAPHALEGGR